MEAKVKVKKYAAGSLTNAEDLVAVEDPLEISLRWKADGKDIERKLAITMRTPGHDGELAAGFLFNEGIISAASQIEIINQADEQQITLTLADGFVPELKQTDRNFYTTSSCGVCGKQELNQLDIASKFIDDTSSITLSSELLLQLESQVAFNQKIFSSTGGLHAAALFNTNGEFVALREDVGRHNALDKLIGAMVLANELPLNENILFLSGRTSFELIQKSSMAGIRIVAAVGAPSSLAVSQAEKSGITLIGFLRNKKFNIYTHTGRVVDKTAFTLINTQSPVPAR